MYQTFLQVWCIFTCRNTTALCCFALRLSSIWLLFRNKLISDLIKWFVYSILLVVLIKLLMQIMLSTNSKVVKNNFAAMGLKCIKSMFKSNMSCQQQKWSEVLESFLLPISSDFIFQLLSCSKNVWFFFTQLLFPSKMQELLFYSFYHVCYCFPLLK